MPLGFFKQRGRIGTFWSWDNSIFLYLPLENDHRDYSFKTSPVLNGSLKFNRLGFRSSIRSTDFDGNSANYISVPDNTYTNPSTLSWVLWYKLPSWGVVPSFYFSKRVFDGAIDYTFERNIVQTDGKDVSFEYYDSGGVQHRYTISNFFNLSDINRWLCMAGTYTFGQGNSIKIWKNGVLQSGLWTSGNGNGARRDSTESILISRQASLSPGPLVGNMCELALFSRRLTSEEVMEYYRWATSQPKKYWYFVLPPLQAPSARRLIIAST